MPRVHLPAQSGRLSPSESEKESPVMREAWHRREIIHYLAGWIFKKLQPFIAQRVLEAGCGAGNLAQLMLDRDLVIGVDYSEEAIAAVRQRFGDRPNFQAYTYDICDPAIRTLGALDIDTVLSLNVLEHIKDDELALGNLFALLRPGGRLALVVPALPWLYGSMDRALGHFRRYTRRDIAHKAERAGFVTERCFYINFFGIFGWFLNGMIFHRDLPSVGQLRLFNKLAPALLGLEAWLAPPVGLSVVYIGRKE